MRSAVERIPGLLLGIFFPAGLQSRDLHDMLPGPASTLGSVDRAANRRPRHIFRRSTEKKSPLNIQFERQVAALESRQQEQSQRCVIFGASPVDLFLSLSTLSPHHVENGHSQVLSKSTMILDGLESSLSSPLIFIHFDVSEESLRRCLMDSSRPSLENSPKSDKAPDSDFLVNTFTKTTVDANRTTRRKSKKKNKRHKRGPCKRVSDASEMQCGQCKNASPSIDVSGGEALTLASNHVADVLFEDTSSPGSEMLCSPGKNTSPSIAVSGDEALPLILSPNHVTDKLFKDSSPGSSVREVSVERPDSEIDNEYGGSLITSISSTFCSDVMDLSRSTTSYFEFCEQSSSNNFICLDSTSNSTLTDSSTDGHCTDSSWNFSDDTENLLIVRNEYPCALSKLTDSGGFKYGGDKNWVNQSNHDKNFCFKNSAGACSGTQEVQLCSNAAAGGDFHLVISRKRARKNRKMQLLGSSNAERMCNVEHAQNEKHASCSSKRMPVELDTMDFSCRPSNVCIQPQHGVASKDFTRDFIHKPSKVRTWIPHKVTLNDYMTGTNLNCLWDPKEHRRVESQKYPSLTEVADSGFCEEKNVGTTKMLPGIVHSDSSQMASSAAYDLVVQKVVEQTCTSRGLSMQQGELQVLLPEDDDAIETGSRLPSSSMTSSLDAFNNSSCVDPKEHKKVENTVSNRPCSLQGDLHAQAAGSQPPAYTTDYWKTSRPTESGSKFGCYGVSAVEGNCNLNQQRFDSSALHLAEMIKAANEAYKVQVASDVHLISGNPIANIETFIHSATPVIGRISCIRSGNCLRDWPVDNSPCQYQISNLSLRSVWEWYEEPGSYGLEVEIHRSLSSTRSTCSGSEFCAYFLPSLSAIQLFGQSSKNLDHKFDREDEAFLLSQPNGAHLLEPSFFVQDHGELLFEYFESEQPSLRPPLFEKIKQLISGVDLSGYQIFGDPKKLENLKLCDLHPASWFCVAWYPICRIPQGNCRATFLTYHSLGKLVPQTCSPDMAGGLTHVVSPVVGLWSYNDKDEQWFQLRDAEFKPMSLNDAPKTDRAEVLKERLRTLRRGASVMASTVIPKANGESMNRHPDYEFFRSRSK